MKLIKKNNIILFDGECEYRSLKTKKVVVDGETYTKDIYENVKSTAEKIYNTENYFHKPFLREYDFSAIGYSAKIKDTSMFYDGFSSFLKPKIIHSENIEANLILECFDRGLLDKRIKNLYIDKTNTYYNEDNFEEILKHMSVPIELFKYGWNYSLYYTIPLRLLFEIPYENIPAKTKRLFQKYDIDLGKKDNLKNAIKLLTSKIRIK
jgi:hypothetical protein